MNDNTDIALEPADIAAADSGAPMEIAAASPAGDDMHGIALAGFAYAFWGIMPLYWRLLSNVGPFELTVHRILWCAVFVAIVALARGRLAHIVASARRACWRLWR
jgi:EamA domain-containing membrane protein RarD